MKNQLIDTLCEMKTEVVHFRVPVVLYHHHARVPEGVAKSQFPLKGSGFQKWKPCLNTVLKGFIPPTTLAWQQSEAATVQGHLAHQHPPPVGLYRRDLST